MKHHILLIDDDIAVLKSLNRLFTHMDYRVTCVEDGLSATRVQLSEIDFVLCDIRMPGMDGFETCRKLKLLAGQRDLPILFMTGDVLSTDHARAASLGANGIFEKPFVAIKMLEQIEEILAQDTAATTS